jgi:hypothetical protein
MVINGAIVSDLDMMYLESVLQEELALCMMMRSSRTEPPDLAGIMRATDDIIESMVCPPPPSEPPVISEEMISGLIVPAPGWSEFRTCFGVSVGGQGGYCGHNVVVDIRAVSIRFLSISLRAFASWPDVAFIFAKTKIMSFFLV